METGKEIDGLWYGSWSDYLQGLCHLCGCGSDAVPNLLLEVLRWCALEHEEKGRQGTYRSTEWELAAKVLDSADLVEHGSGIGWPWITPKGKEVLAIIDGWP
jgi:hypothetical protein